MPHEKYGNASLNSLSKSIFNLLYKSIKVGDYEMFNKKTKIALQAHIYYKELINEIVEKSNNNIPLKFDFFISTDSKFKKEFIEKFIHNNTNGINYTSI